MYLIVSFNHALWLLVHVKFKFSIQWNVIVLYNVYVI